MKSSLKTKNVIYYLEFEKITRQNLQNPVKIKFEKIQSTKFYKLLLRRLKCLKFKEIKRQSLQNTVQRTKISHIFKNFKKQIYEIHFEGPKLKKNIANFSQSYYYTMTTSIS